MNILMISGRLPSHPLDGGTTRVYHMAQQWSKRHRVAIVAPSFVPNGPEGVAAIAEEMQADLYAVPVQLEGKLRRAFGHPTRLVRGLSGIDCFPEVSAFVRHLVRDQSFDAVELEGSGGGIYLPALDGLASRPRVVLVLYDVMWHWWMREFLGAPRPAPLARWISHRLWEPRFIAQADCCVFMSRTDEERVVRVVRPKRKMIIPNGIAYDAFQAGPLPEAPEVLFVGSFAHLPNKQAVRWLAEAIWPALKCRVPAAHLTIVGREPTQELVTLAESAGVEVDGDVQDVRPYYARARAVVVPIRTGGGIRVKILEACAAARPVVTTRVGAEGLPLIPGRHALFADRVEDIVEALVRVLTDRPLAERLAANGRELVEREFDWGLLASRQERALNEV